MAHSDEDRKALGQRLAAARKEAEHTLESAASALRDDGYTITKQTIGAWEKGRNLPDAIWLHRLAKVYETTTDALMGETAVSKEAHSFAARFDELPSEKKEQFRLIWNAVFRKGAEDDTVEQRMPVTKEHKVHND